MHSEVVNLVSKASIGRVRSASPRWSNTGINVQGGNPTRGGSNAIGGASLAACKRDAPHHSTIAQRAPFTATCGLSSTMSAPLPPSAARAWVKAMTEDF